MKKLIFILIILLAGCDFKLPCYKTSDLKEEGAEIIQLSYIPDTSSSGVGVGTGMTMNGDMAISVVPISSYSPEVWAVVLRCDKHNKTFAIKSKQLYDKVKQGDRVILKYVEDIRYYKEIPNSEEVVGQHTKQIIFGDKIINRQPTKMGRVNNRR